jgi:hypothetical protein
MLSTYFYNARVRKAVAAFGSLFDNIFVVRKNSSGQIISQVKVPLSYAPKRDFLARIDAMGNGEDAERQIAIKLPRMSFEIIGISYDASRQLPKLNNCAVIADNSSSNNDVLKLYSPVPYLINFQLSIYAKGQDDALQIVEQILPYFAPEYTVSIKPIDGYSEFVEDSPIKLDNVTFVDDFEAPLEARRSIIYTLDFEMKINLYRMPSTNSPVITATDTNLFNPLDATDPFDDVQLSGNVIKNNSGTVNENESITVSNLTITIPQDEIESFTIGSQASNGTASTTFTQNTFNAQNLPISVGTWTYTPNAEFFGVDSFVIYANFAGSSGRLDIPVNVTITAVP